MATPSHSATATVVVATDARGSAQAAATLLGRVADPDRVAVTVVGVADDDPGHADRRADRGGIGTAVAATADRLTSAGFETATDRAHGDPATRILEAADGHGADLIVLGARPWGLPGVLGDVRRAAERIAGVPDSDRRSRASLFDSVSTAVVHHAAVPVMVVHEARPPTDPVEHARVLVGADGSPAADAARTTFMLVADPSRVDVTVIAVAVDDPNLEVRVDAAGGPVIAIGSRVAVVDPAVAHEVAEEQEHPAHTAALAAARDLRDHGFRARTDILGGDPRHVLPDHVRRDAIDLAVVGSRGLGLLRRAALGSVSETLLHAGPATLVARGPDARSG